ncbi:MAG: HD domain-containing protein, partial [Planctomycetales bacterium]
CLLQFNQYHSYTVDEHTLRAVEALEGFDRDQGPLGTAYRKVKHKRLLHLAMILHDLGKGFERDHSELGGEMAADVAVRLGLPAPQREALVFLVQKHLSLSRQALHRDLADPELLARFSRDVGSPEWLRMLYVLTAADISAVGPGAWTSWKAELLTELFERTLHILTGEPSKFREAEAIGQVVQQVLETLRIRGTPDATLSGADLQRQADRLRDFPTHYLVATAPQQIADDLAVIDRLAMDASEPVVRGAFEPHSQTVEYRIITRDAVGSGLFSKICGALTAKGMQILAASICTTSDGAVIDSFRVTDADFAVPVPDFRLREVEEAVRTVVLGGQSVEQLFQKHRRFLPRAETQLLFREPTRVVIDNDSSERSTVIEIFAHDRRGLLYAIAVALVELELSICVAKIGTHVDQALDVFYVTDRGGGKVVDDTRLERIRTVLAERIEDFERRGLS